VTFNLTGNQQDPWLSRTVLTPLIDIWAYGPKTAFPEYDFGLSSTEESRLTETSKEIPVTSPEHSPIAGIDFLQRRENGPVKILHFIGTADVLHPGAEMMQKRLDTMDSGVVQAETHIVSLQARYSNLIARVLNISTR
jgi:hypothetical protein